MDLPVPTGVRDYESAAAVSGGSPRDYESAAAYHTRHLALDLLAACCACSTTRPHYLMEVREMLYRRGGEALRIADRSTDPIKRARAALFGERCLAEAAAIAKRLDERAGLSGWRDSEGRNLPVLHWMDALREDRL